MESGRKTSTKGVSAGDVVLGTIAGLVAVVLLIGIFVGLAKEWRDALSTIVDHWVALVVAAAGMGWMFYGLSNIPQPCRCRRSAGGDGGLIAGSGSSSTCQDCGGSTASGGGDGGDGGDGGGDGGGGGD